MTKIKKTSNILIQIPENFMYVGIEVSLKVCVQKNRVFDWGK